jgi:hypothetical protein
MNRNVFFKDAKGYLGSYDIDVQYSGGREAKWMDKAGFRFVKPSLKDQFVVELAPAGPKEHANVPFQYEAHCKDFNFSSDLTHPSSINTILAPQLRDLTPGTSILPHLQKVGPEVFRVPIFEKEYCKQLFNEVQRISKESGLPLDNNGLHLTYFGFTPLFEKIVSIFSEGVVSKIHPEANLRLTSAFIVFYKPGDKHVIHDDDSDLTININLGEEGLEGGNLIIKEDVDEGSAKKPQKPPSNSKYLLYRNRSSSSDDNYSSSSDDESHNTAGTVSIPHQIGYALMHAGRISHGAEPLISGTRMNLILWMDCPSKFHMFEQLPDTTKFEIFSHLTLLDLNRLLCTSKQMYQMRDSEEMWSLYKTKSWNKSVARYKTGSPTCAAYLETLAQDVDSAVIERIRRHLIAADLMTSFSKYSVQEWASELDSSISSGLAGNVATELQATNPEAYRRIWSSVVEKPHRRRLKAWFLPEGDDNKI